jgi:hypothetical protein
MKRLRDGMVELVSRWDLPITFTLNVKPGLSRARVEEAGVFLWKWTDREIYGRKRADAGRSLERLCVLDGSDKLKNWHFHCAIKRPPPEYYGGTIDDFCALLRSRWEALEEAGTFSLCEPAKCQIAWLKYICGKEVTGAGEVCWRTTVLHV